MEKPFDRYMEQYQKCLKAGEIQKAYRGLMGYIAALRNYMINKYPDGFVAGDVYQGYMDISYFPFTSRGLKEKKLKVAVVFNHEKVRFEVWLVGQNKGIQNQFRQLFREKGWHPYPVAAESTDAVIESVLVAAPDFARLDVLTGQIEAGVMTFIREVERFFQEK